MLRTFHDAARFGLELKASQGHLIPHGTTLTASKVDRRKTASTLQVARRTDSHAGKQLAIKCSKPSCRLILGGGTMHRRFGF
eukprot:4425082-Pleurochrysis_carterae.AAC.1